MESEKKKFHPGNQSIVHFVDLIEKNKKEYEADSPRSILGPVEAFKEGFKISFLKKSGQVTFIHLFHEILLRVTRAYKCHTRTHSKICLPGLEKLNESRILV